MSYPVLCYTITLDGDPFMVGETIPANQTTILKKDVLIVEIKPKCNEIWGKVSGIVHQVCFPAEELGLTWREIS